MRWRRPPAPPGRLPPPPGGRDPPPLDRRDDGGRRCNGSGESGSPATATMSMPVIDIGALFIGREDWEGDDGSGVAVRMRPSRRTLRRHRHSRRHSRRTQRPYD
jgi:hypothetical protein